VLFTKTHGRVLGPGLAALDPNLPAGLAKRSPLALPWKNLTRELDRFIGHGLPQPESSKLDLTRNFVMTKRLLSCYGST